MNREDVEETRAFLIKRATELERRAKDLRVYADSLVTGAAVQVKYDSRSKKGLNRQLIVEQLRNKSPQSASALAKSLGVHLSSVSLVLHSKEEFEKTEGGWRLVDTSNPELQSPE